MGITGIHAIPIMITCMLQGTLCNTGIPRTFYGESICSVCTAVKSKGKISQNFVAFSEYMNFNGFVVNNFNYLP